MPTGVRCCEGRLNARHLPLVLYTVKTTPLKVVSSLVFCISVVLEYIVGNMIRDTLLREVVLCAVLDPGFHLDLTLHTRYLVSREARAKVVCCPYPWHDPLVTGPESRNAPLA